MKNKKFLQNDIGNISFVNELDKKEFEKKYPRQPVDLDKDRLGSIEVNPGLAELVKELDDKWVQKIWIETEDEVSIVIERKPTFNPIKPDEPVDNNIYLRIRGEIEENWDPVLSDNPKTKEGLALDQVIWPEDSWGNFFITTHPSSEYNGVTLDRKTLVEVILEDKF